MSKYKKTILIVDDDIVIGNLIEEVLTSSGYRVKRAYSGSEALLILEKERPDLLLLDLMLPGLSGEELIKDTHDIPVIVVSAKNSAEDKVNLLLNGASDYMTKPFDTKELLARIKLRINDKKPYKNDGFSLNKATMQVFYNGTFLPLTKTEYIIAKELIEHPYQVVTKSELLDLISIDTPDCSENSLKTHIYNLRQKLKKATEKDYIESVWGIGYILEENS